MRAEIFVHKPHQRRRLLLFFCRFVCKYLCKKHVSAGRTTRKTSECTAIFAYICNSHHVVISENKLNKYISFLLALPGWLYHSMMVATNHLPGLQAKKITVHLVWRCWLDLKSRGNILAGIWLGSGYGGWVTGIMSGLYGGMVGFG
jgi:hypothetical protein